jgi:uncharacterized protein YijF (DUF1287 family)
VSPPTPILFAAILLIAACDAPAAATPPGQTTAQAADVTQVKAPVATERAAAPEQMTRADKGIFSELDPKVRVRWPAWLEAGPAVLVRVRGEQEVWALVDGVPVGLADASWGPIIEIKGWGAADADGDGIPDQVDMLIGARKTALDAAPYIGGYQQLKYPGGDVPRTEGVCTDVIIRAARNMGVDLQVSLHEDIKAAPRAFPMVKKADPNIDQRRVKTLLPHFKRHWRALSTDPADRSQPWLPGDVLFMQTMGDERPDHLGVVSDVRGQSGYPLVINSWTDGYSTGEMDLLAFVPITHRFRRARAAPVMPEAERGLQGVLARQGWTLAPEVGQVVLVSAPTWDVPTGQLRRYERAGDGWRRVGEPIAVRLGRAGLGRGRGQHGDEQVAAPGAWPGPIKREGDGRSPAGVFRLGTAFGPQAAPYKGKWPWRAVGAADRFVDDPASPQYNTWQVEGAGRWSSAEALSMYPLGLVVEHNMAPISPGAGSAIFLHPDLGERGPTTGCTAMERAELVRLLGWLDPARSPALVQVAGAVFE